jgi:hypothetical protein
LLGSASEDEEDEDSKTTSLPPEANNNSSSNNHNVRGASSPGASLLVGAGDIKVDPSMTTPEKDSINDSEVSGSKLGTWRPQFLNSALSC